MSHLLARIMLALLMLPLASVVYIFVVVCLDETIRGSRDTEISFLAATGASWGFIAVYWVLLWFKTVRWTGWRIQGSIGAAVACSLGGLVLGVLGDALVRGSGFGIFLGGVFAILTWLAATVLLWRERASERFGRIADSGSAVLLCPRCNYNMTGLRTSACPECGASFTLEELFTETNADAELEDA